MSRKGEKCKNILDGECSAHPRFAYPAGLIIYLQRKRRIAQMIEEARQALHNTDDVFLRKEIAALCMRAHQRKTYGGKAHANQRCTFGEVGTKTCKWIKRQRQLRRQP